MRTDTAPVIRLKDYRPPAYTINEVDLDFSLEPEATKVRSAMVVERAKDTAKDAPLILDGDELELVSVSVDGRQVPPDDYKASPQKLELKKLPRKKRFTVTVETRIDPTANTRLMGLYRSNGNYCTQCEAEGFRRITYFLDRPDVMAVYTTRIEADARANPVLLSNGNPVKSGKLAGNRHYAVWHDPHPKPGYLFALVAGDLDVLKKNFTTMSGRKVKLGIYVEKGKKDRAAYAMDALVRSMKWDEETFGREYDLDVFNIVAVSDFNMGAMENKGLNIFNDKYVLADERIATDLDYANIEAIIAHEYFHNWTGNRITCRDWFQLCLKEGLTVYRDQEFSADMRSRAVERIGDVRNLRANQFPEDSGPLSHPVRPESYREINNFYTATVYEKGAEVVRMIATILGRKKFRKGMDLYFKRHDGEAATIEQFVKCFEDAGKVDLTQFSLWYSQAGTPTLPVSADYNKAKKVLTLDIEQSLAPTPDQTRKKAMHIPLRIGLVGSDGEAVEAGRITGAEHEGDLFHLKHRNHKIVFHGVENRPAVSLNRGFTAPVRIEFSQSKADLALLAHADSDPFNRWQAFQEFAMRMLTAGARAIERGGDTRWDEKFLEAALAATSEKALEPAFRAAMLTLPGEGEIAQTLGRNVDPDAIHAARMGLMAAMGKVLEPARLAMGAELATPGPYRPDAEDAGKRSLKNTLLLVGVAAGSRQAKADCLDEFDNANNMNDRFAAFQRIVHLHGHKAAKQAIDAFEKDYGGDPLTLDKWFSVIAGTPGKQAVATVKKLMKHKAFTLANPNRARSVLGAFAMANPTGFNDASGEGYRLVADKVGELDALNPQIAARLLTAFRSLKMLEPKRRALAVEALEELRAGRTPSRDCSEIVERILAQ
ncbi:MAG: aminopeptidase N [Salaquimonas sp.]|nr:aminopeptidase N [Salaquimonas sp.]